MVKYARAHDEIEAPRQLANVLEWQLLELEIRQVVLTLEYLGMLDARRADVDADDAGIRAADGVLGRLLRATSRDENVQVATVRSMRPYQVILGAMANLVAPFIARAIQVGDGGWIGVPGVELGHRVRVHIRCAVDANADASHDRW